MKSRARAVKPYETRDLCVWRARRRGRAPAVRGRPEQLWELAQALCEPSTPEATPLPARPANHSKASRAACLGSGWPEPSSHREVSVDTLIDAIDNWQDSQHAAWLASAEAQCERLVRQWREAPRRHGERIPAIERIQAALNQGSVPWDSQAWLALRRQDA